MVTTADLQPAHAFPVRGREAELRSLAGLLDGAERGSGGALILLGRPGLGKTALLDMAADQVDDRFRVVRASGTPAEAGLPLAGLHQIVTPLAGFLPELSPSHREPLGRVLELGGGDGDAVTLGAAVHALLAAAARDTPTVCCADSAHALDHDSLAALVFAARRLATSPVAILLAADPSARRALIGELADLPSRRLRPVDEPTARQILQDRLGASVPQDLADGVIDLAAGNPLALTELAAAVTVEQLSGREAPPVTLPAEGRLRRTVRKRLAGLPEPSRNAVLLAAVDERLDLSTVHRALPSAADGAIAPAVEAAIDAGLLTVRGEAVQLPDDLPRGAVLAAANAAELSKAHRLLATTTDPAADRFRWTWHRAATATAPDPDLALELDAIAEEARGRRAHHDAGAASTRAAELSAHAGDRTPRLMAAAADYWAAGKPQRARTALRAASPHAHDPLAGLAGLLHGEIELRRGNPATAAAGLLDTAQRLAGQNDDEGRELAAASLLLAGEASCVAGDSERYCDTALHAARLHGAATQPEIRQVLEHFAAMGATFSGRHAQAERPLREVVLLGRTTPGPTSKILGSQAAFALGEAAATRDLALDAVASAKSAGNPAPVPWALVYASLSALLSGAHETAVSASLEGLWLAESLGQPNCAVDHLTILAMLAALQGDGETTAMRLSAATSGMAERGLGRPGALATWAGACADLADDRPADALDRFRRMTLGQGRNYSPLRVMAVPDFVEAAVRCGQSDQASRALDAFERWANQTGGTARRALAHRCHALLADHEGAAEEHFMEAIRLHRDAAAPYDLAHTELLYAARLRRHRKPSMARDVLREAVQVFEDLGATHWVKRAQRELRACGYPVPATGGRDTGNGELTPQQEQIASLVSEGATNREIAARLFISPRTVDHHLRNIFTRLGIRSRVQLANLYR